MIEARQERVPVLKTGMETGKGTAAEGLLPLPGGVMPGTQENILRTVARKGVELSWGHTRRIV